MLIKKTISCHALFFLLSTIGLLISGCKESRLKIDTDKIMISPDFQRFDEDLFKLPEPVSASAIEMMRKKYPSFFDLFISKIIRLPAGDDSVLASSLSYFIHDKDVQSIHAKTSSVFADLNWLKNDLTEMLKYYHYYFPSKPVPDIITYISAFNYTVITTDSALGIGLDMYLGKDCPFYPGLGLPKYMTDKLSKEYIVRDAIKAMFQSDYDPDQVSNEFLSQIVYQGKLLYYTDMMAPEMDDTIKIGYTSQQLAWCNGNEANIWGFMIENDLLYSKEPTRYIRYINDGNTTQGLPKESPAKLGAWIGWKIARAYMENHPGVKPEAFLMEKDAQKILSESGYKPRK
jgi:hypothetical protein